MKKIACSCVLLAMAALQVAYAEEERMVDKAGRTVLKGAETAASGIEKGAEATNKGVNKAVDATSKVFEKADHWIQNKINKKGDSPQAGDGK